ncbi:MAG: hypothetical protein ACRDJP_05205 [Actinomycetota bacterium]
MADDRLEERLGDIGSRLDHPDGSGVAPAVRRRLEEERLQAIRRRPSRAASLVAAAVLVTVAGAAVAGIVIRGVHVERVPTQPTAPAPGRPEELALGRRVSLARARDAVDINVLVPQRLGRPDAVYVGREPSGGRVTLLYEPGTDLPRDPNTGAGMLVTLFRGSTDTSFVRKEVGPATSVRMIDVEGAPGMWIEGAPHRVLYQDQSGRLFRDSLRLAGNVMIWQLGEITLRLESRLSFDPSLDVAESMA